MTAGATAASESGVPPSPDVVDEAVGAAAGTRTAARWLASALGGIPSLAILASIVRAPGDAGFDETKLAVGVALAVLGAIVGVLGFARVIAPVPLEDKDLRGFDLTRIPGQPFTTFEELVKDMTDLRSGATGEEYEATGSLRASKRAEVKAQQDEAAAKTAEQEAAANPTDQALQQRAAEARTRADAAQRDAAAKAAQAAADAAGLGVWTEQLSRREAIRRDVYRLKAADEVGRRYLHARVAAVFAAGLIAAGVVLLGLAPKPKAATSPTLPRLVTLTLNQAGQRALGCSANSLRALQTGGDASAPIVITLPTPDCPSRAVVFTTTKPEGFGTVAPVQPIKAG